MNVNDVGQSNTGFVYQATSDEILDHATDPLTARPRGFDRRLAAKTTSKGLHYCVSSRRRFLHWVSALLVVALYLPLSSIGVDTHKLIGIIVLGLFCARLSFSLSGDHVSHTRHSRFESIAAVTVQGFILGAILLLPITGLLMHMLSGPGVAIGGFSEQFLKWPVSSPTLVRWLTRLHTVLSIGLLIALIFHISGALKHHFCERDGTLSRMFTGYLKNEINADTFTPPATVSRGRLLSLAVAVAVVVGASLIHIRKETNTYDWQNWEQLISANRKISDSDLSALANSEITIAGRHHGRAFDATFSNFKMNLALSESGEPQLLDVAIEAQSFRSDLLRRDRLVASEHWLNTAHYPIIRYQSSRFEKIGDDSWIANGYMDFKKWSVPVPVGFSLTPSSDGVAQFVAKGHVSLDRFDLGLGTGQWFNTTKAARSFQVDYTVYLGRPSSE